jgi:RNA polymerase sigma factor (sigma-70 family)
MDEHTLLAEQFEANREHLRSVAYRMLGSRPEADDAVQEAWIRLSRSDSDSIDNLGGWLTTVVSRVCLDHLRARAAHPEISVDAARGALAAPRDEGPGPEQEAVLADSVGLAMLVVLEHLAPPERVAFVLHDLFAVPFEEIAPIVDRSPAATRQLASRARRRVQGASADPVAARARQREVVDAFLAASRSGDLAGLIALLDPDVVARADAFTVQTGAEPEVVGATAVAETFAGRAKAAQPAVIDGAVGLVWKHGGEVRVVFDLTIVGGTIAAVELVSDPETLAAMEIEPLD